MKKKILFRSLLILLAAALLAGGLHFRNLWRQEKEVCDTASQRLQLVTEQVAQLEEKLAALTLDKAQEQTLRAEQLQDSAEELIGQMDALKTEIEELTLFLEENQDVAANAEEELTYLQGVYDALDDGLQKVEEYIAAD